MNASAISDKEIKSPAQSSQARWLKQVRQLHLYLGTFFGPSILFFALSGALQLFGLHEGHPGEAYQPPAWIQKVGSIHKDQAMPERRGPPPGAAERERPSESDEARRPPQPEGGHRNEERGPIQFTLALKWFFLAMAAGLVFSTVTGIYMAFKYNRSRALVWSLLLVGTAIPVALVAMLA